MNRIRRPSTTLAALACALVALTGPVLAQQDYPIRPIRVIVPYAPGGTDQQIRILAPTFAQVLGQPLVIENREGGGATLGTALVKQSKPDGYTLLYTGTGALTVAPLVRKQSYTLDDFVPIGNVTGIPFIVAASGPAPFRTLPDMIAFAKANPERVTFGSAGQSTTTHMAGEALAGAAKIKLLHVPYQGIGPAVSSALGGNVHLVVGLPSAILPQVNAGKLFPLAITGPERLALLNNIPTLREQGVDVLDVTKFGLFAPRGTPEPIVQKLVTALAQAVKQPEFLEAMRKGFNNVLYMDPPTYRETLDAELKHFRKLIDDLGLAEKS